MSKSKRERWAEVKQFPNVLEPYDEDVDIKGKWGTQFFENGHPLVLELACGKAEYTLALAGMYPHKNFVGVDIKGERIWKGAKRALEANLTNVGFLRIQIEHILDYFEKNEVEAIWLTFPDPYPKRKHRKKRLTYPRFLDYYKHIVKPGGLVHLKTDAEHLYKFSIEQITNEKLDIVEQIPDIYKNPDALPPELEIKTFYEKGHLAEGRSIYYLCFRL